MAATVVVAVVTEFRRNNVSRAARFRRRNQLDLPAGLCQPHLGKHVRLKAANSRTGIRLRCTEIIALKRGASGPDIEFSARARKRDRICGTERLDRRWVCDGSGMCQI